MRDDIQREQWDEYIKEFSERNSMRPTRLEVMGQPGAFESDFWLEGGLPLAGISLEPEGEGAPQIEIMLGGEANHAARHMTHTVSGVQRVVRETGEDGREATLELEDKEGAITILHFE